MNRENLLKDFPIAARLGRFYMRHFKYVATDKNGDVFLYSSKPIKSLTTDKFAVSGGFDKWAVTGGYYYIGQVEANEDWVNTLEELTE